MAGKKSPTENNEHERDIVGRPVAAPTVIESDVNPLLMRVADLEARERSWAELVAPLHQELYEAGVDVKNYRHVIDKPKNYRVGIAILVRHMQMDRYPDLIRNFMAQAVAMRETNPHWDLLVHCFKKMSSENPRGSFVQGLAVALSAAHKSQQLDELIALCEDETYGIQRVLLANGLRRSRDPRAEICLMKLSRDPVIGKQVGIWLRKRRVTAALLQ